MILKSRLICMLWLGFQCLGFGAEMKVVQDSVEADAQTEAIISSSIKYLVSKQSANGAIYSSDMERTFPLAMTSYSLLAMISAGSLPGEGPYGKNASAALKYIMDAVQPTGLLAIGNTKYMYSHGLATLTLAEVYGHIKTPQLRAKLESMIKVIETSQNAEGGWRYEPKPKEADLSVTVMQVVALRAAKLNGISVSQKVINQAIQYIRKCYNESKSEFIYQLTEKGGGGGTRNAAGMYALQVCGEYTDSRVKAMEAYFLTKAGMYTANQAYGANYATPAMYLVGGKSWELFYNTKKADFLKTVKRDKDLTYWEDEKDVGPIYRTSTYVTALAMPFHYVPIYQR